MSQTNTTAPEIEENKEVNPSKPLSEGLKLKIKAMQEEFYSALQKAKYVDEKTIDNSDNASEYFYDRLHSYEKRLLNKVSPLDDWRAEELEKLRKALTDSKQDLINAFESIYKRSAENTQLYELDLILDELDNTIANYKYWVREKIDTPLTYNNTDSYLYYEPVGLVLIIGEWQSPLYSLLKPAISALAAGNHVILYADPQVKKVIDVLNNVLTRHTDERRIQIITDRTSYEQLLDLPINQVYASGTPAQCKEIYKLAGERGIPAALSERALNVAVVHKSADLNQATEKIVLSRFINAGQYNTSTDHVYVHESLFTDFLVKAKIHIYCNYTNPEKNRDYGRLINQDHVRKILDIASAESHEGQLETRINYDLEGNLVEPIIITQPSESSRAVSYPVRGPVLSIIKYKDIEEVTNKLKGRAHINNVYYFANDSEQSARFIAKVSNANVFINEAGTQYFNFNLPFGSVGGIYNAKIGGAYGVRTFSNSRVVTEGKGLRQFKSLIPPISGTRYTTFHRFDLLKKFTVRQGRALTTGAGLLLAYFFLKK